MRRYRAEPWQVPGPFQGGAGERFPPRDGSAIEALEILDGAVMDRYKDRIA